MSADREYVLEGHRSMTESDIQGGRAWMAAATMPVSVGVFDSEDPLIASGAGHSPRCLGQIEVLREDLPAGAELRTGMRIEVSDCFGNARVCRVESWRSVGPLVQITLAAVDQGA
jgi:hypothetical protein